MLSLWFPFAMGHWWSCGWWFLVLAQAGGFFVQTLALIQVPFPTVPCVAGAVGFPGKGSRHTTRLRGVGPG
jgi:hypothetical protein